MASVAASIARLEARIDSMRTDLAALIGRFDSHVDNLHYSHEHNHHGPASRLKLGGATAIISALLLGAWEVVRQLVL